MKILKFLFALAFLAPVCCQNASETTVEHDTNIYEETIPMLWMSKLVYNFAILVKAGREGKLELAFPPEILEQYKDERLDVRGLNDGNGLSFNQVARLIDNNKKQLIELSGEEDAEFVSHILENLKAIEDADPTSDSIFLETFSSLNQANQCVYGVLKDDNNKRIIIVFRGSTSPSETRDWTTNLNAHMADLKTPKLIKDKMNGSMKENILVHEGFYEYIFDNSEVTVGKQRYDMILDDIKPFMKEGYSLYLTGHSLGAALSSLTAFKLAGSEKPWIPKPVTCISFSSPFVGGSEFRTAFQQLEEDGLIKYLRVTNTEDPIPTLPPFSRGFKKRLMKHVGIHLNLKKKNYAISHPNGRNGIIAALNNSILKPAWAIMTYHMLPITSERIEMHRDDLSKLTIDGIYQDETVMGKNFNLQEL